MPNYAKCDLVSIISDKEGARVPFITHNAKGCKITVNSATEMTNCIVWPRTIILWNHSGNDHFHHAVRPLTREELDTNFQMFHKNWRIITRQASRPNEWRRPSKYSTLHRQNNHNLIRQNKGWQISKHAEETSYH